MLMVPRSLALVRPPLTFPTRLIGHPARSTSRSPIPTAGSKPYQSAPRCQTLTPSPSFLAGEACSAAGDGANCGVIVVAMTAAGDGANCGGIVVAMVAAGDGANCGVIVVAMAV